MEQIASEGIRNTGDWTLLLVNFEELPHFASFFFFYTCENHKRYNGFNNFEDTVQFDNYLLFKIEKYIMDMKNLCQFLSRGLRTKKNCEMLLNVIDIIS